MRFRTYTLRVEADQAYTMLPSGEERLQAGLQHAEDVVNDALPEGFYCKIDEAQNPRLSDAWSK